MRSATSATWLSSLLKDAPDFTSWTTAELLAAKSLLAADLEKADPLQPDDYEALFDTFADDFSDQLSGYADAVISDDISAARFRQRMTSSIRAAYATAYRYGAASVVGRTVLTDDDLVAIRGYLGDELDYLDNFARQIKAGDVSDAELKSRTDLYANAVRALYWKGKTSRQPTSTLVYWDAEDDRETCDSCAQAEFDSPYTIDNLPGMPGADVCDGLDRCRCKLRYEQIGATDEVTDETDMTDLGSISIPA